MIERLYVHNFRCLENFELALGGKPSVLLIGKNGAGKSTIRGALELLQRVARGVSRVGQLVSPRDHARRDTTAPMRLELDVRLGGRLYCYKLALDLPAKFKELRVHSEQLLVDGEPIYSRELARVSLNRADSAAEFLVDWHLVALPILQEQSELDPLFIIKSWLAHSIVLAPVPGMISGDSSGDSLEPELTGHNLGAWFSGVLAHSPAAYATIERFVRDILPDFVDVKNPIVGGERRALRVQFRANDASLQLRFADLSDGEKCIFICALVVAANAAYGPLLCFWDEPDSHLSISEVGHLTLALRRAFDAGGQILLTSHNAETIRRFADENTLLLFRRDHLEPTRVRVLADIPRTGDLVEALIRGDIEP